MSQTADASQIALRSVRQHGDWTASSFDDLQSVEGLPTTADVTYTVRVTRSLRSGANGRVDPFTLAGKVVISNPAPRNARLSSVTISISDPYDRADPLTVAASCPILAVASGQSLTCSWTLRPLFNPVGGVVVATANYAATFNGAAPSGDTIKFKSAAHTVGDERIDATQVEVNGAIATFVAGVASFHRTLLQWTASTRAFNPAGFLSRVWGYTGANTIVTSQPAAAPATFAPAAQQQASQHNNQPASADRQLPGSYNNFAAPAPIGSWPGATSGLVKALDPSAAEYGADVGTARQSPTALFATGSTGKPAEPASAAAESQAVSSSAWFPALGTSSSRSGSVPKASEDPHKRIAAPASVSSTTRSNLVQAEAPRSDPEGLLDDCTDISHELGSEPGLFEGRVVSGKIPAGRVCGDAVFVYSVRYGPSAACSAGRAAAIVRVITADTRRTSSSRTEVDVSVRGCSSGVLATVAAARAVADIKATWSMQMHAANARLQLQPGQGVNNSYTVRYDRHLEALTPRLYVMLSLQSTASTGVLLGEGLYTVNVTCGAHNHTKSAPFVCSNNRVTAGALVNCSFVVPLPCAADGVLQAQLQLSTGQTVRTVVTSFLAPNLEELAAAQPSQRATCIKVRRADLCRLCCVSIVSC